MVSDLFNTYTQYIFTKEIPAKQTKCKCKLDYENKIKITFLGLNEIYTVIWSTFRGGSPVNRMKFKCIATNTLENTDILNEVKRI